MRQTQNSRHPLLVIGIGLAMVGILMVIAAVIAVFLGFWNGPPLRGRLFASGIFGLLISVPMAIAGICMWGEFRNKS